MQSATKLRHESDAAYQISPKPIWDTNEYAKKDVGGRGGAHKYINMKSEYVVFIALGSLPYVT